MRLYVNGVLNGSSGAFTCIAAGGAVTVTLGNKLGNTFCTSGYGDSFNGAIDDFYFYLGELTAAEISMLANP